MTPRQLRAWLGTMRYSHKDAARMLGRSANTVSRWVMLPLDKDCIPEMVALACMALYREMGPWAHDEPLKPKPRRKRRTLTPEQRAKAIKNLKPFRKKSDDGKEG